MPTNTLFGWTLSFCTFQATKVYMFHTSDEGLRWDSCPYGKFPSQVNIWGQNLKWANHFGLLSFKRQDKDPVE